MELEVLVIPNITYANENYFDHMLDGMESSKIVAFSIKGSIKDSIQKSLFLKALKVTVDQLIFLEKIIVYSVCVDDNVVMKLFEYAIKKHIDIVIPQNILRERNIVKR